MLVYLSEKTEKMDCFVFGALISRIFPNSQQRGYKVVLLRLVFVFVFVSLKGNERKQVFDYHTRY